ncbi:MAG: glycosyltransferase [Woeseiaceae bacterium]
MIETQKKTVLFYRDFRRYSGGHLKVWHYFNYVKASANYIPRVFFTENSVWNESNPWWHGDESEIARTWTPSDADVLFIGGMDWNAMPADLLQTSSIPIINIVQGLSHTIREDPKYKFLRHKAIRVCVSPILEEALLSVPHVNGPVVHVPMGLDLGELPQENRDRFDVVIGALKAPRLGAKIAKRLKRSSLRIELLKNAMPRRDYLQKIADSRVVVLLPSPLEGFYLPMLEAMAMNRIAVCPDCVANRAYCIPGTNGFMPEYSAQAIEVAIESALAMSPPEAQAMSNAAAQTAAAYTMERERGAFLNVLSSSENIWRDINGI